MNQLNLNASKTEFICFGSEMSLRKHNDIVLKVENKNIKQSSEVKYLGLTIDNRLNFNTETKKILRKMAMGIKVLSSLGNSIPLAARKVILNAIVLSHVQYSSLFLIGLCSNLQNSLEVQWNWAIKTVLKKSKFVSSTDLKKSHKILPIRFHILYRCLVYYYKFEHKLLPSYSSGKNCPRTFNFRKNNRTKQIAWNILPRSKVLSSCFAAIVHREWNYIPCKVKDSKTIFSFKKRLKDHLLAEYMKIPAIMLKPSWKDYRFQKHV